MTDDQLVRQLAGLSAGAAVFGGVDDADGFGVRHPSIPRRADARALASEWLRHRSRMRTTRIGTSTTVQWRRLRQWDDTGTAARRARTKGKERGSTKSASASRSKHPWRAESFVRFGERGWRRQRSRRAIIAEGPRARPRGGKSHQGRIHSDAARQATRQAPVAPMRCRLRSTGSSEWS
jgi:hypothetical protein